MLDLKCWMLWIWRWWSLWYWMVFFLEKLWCEVIWWWKGIWIILKWLRRVFLGGGIILVILLWSILMGILRLKIVWRILLFLEVRILVFWRWRVFCIDILVFWKCWWWWGLMSGGGNFFVYLLFLMVRFCFLRMMWFSFVVRSCYIIWCWSLWCLVFCWRLLLGRFRSMYFEWKLRCWEVLGKLWFGVVFRVWIFFFYVDGIVFFGSVCLMRDLKYSYVLIVLVIML